MIPSFGQHLTDGVGQSSVVRIQKVRYDQPDTVAGLLSQASGLQIRVVVQHLACREHSATGLLRYECTAAEDTGRRGD